MRISLCNEVLADLDFEHQCQYASALGYDGLEVAPYTLTDDPRKLSENELYGYKAMAQDAGIAITSLHWLLLAPKGLSIVDPDSIVRSRTFDLMHRLVDQCALLGGSVLVHGSPGQRHLERDGDRERAEEFFAAAGDRAGQAGVTYCVEPLARRETNFINTVAEAAELVRRLDRPALKTMLDTSAAANTETDTPARLLETWLPSGLIAHIQVNDRNRRGPGQGGDRFKAVLETLGRYSWAGTIVVEPFIYKPDGPSTAALAIGYLRGLLEDMT
jgi:sugar phosphate isomerase/epimerase